MKYKYLFRFGHGPKVLDLLGPSISYFWNDIYDMFDLHREMFIEKLDESVFSRMEIKRLFRELSEDMEEDSAEIWLEIQNGGKRLRFLEINISSEAKSLIEESKIELLDPRTMLKKINERNLDMALAELRCNIGVEDKFTKEKFGIYLDLVRSATSNLGKKDSLEDLSKYFLNGVEGFKVIDRDYRGLSEELDLLVANESEDILLNTIGNPIAVECRHRRKPASSKEIRDFRGKLTDMGLKGGILITLQGVTGNGYDAVAIIREARKNGTSIIVVTLEDLRQIAEGRTPTQILKECFYKYV
jgi:hypothetical protein